VIRSWRCFCLRGVSCGCLLHRVKHPIGYATPRQVGLILPRPRLRNSHIHIWRAGTGCDERSCKMLSRGKGFSSVAFEILLAHVVVKYVGGRDALLKPLKSHPRYSWTQEHRQNWVWLDAKTSASPKFCYACLCRTWPIWYWSSGLRGGVDALTGHRWMIVEAGRSTSAAPMYFPRRSWFPRILGLWGSILSL
jgi:hypothetical protein